MVESNSNSGLQLTWTEISVTLAAMLTAALIVFGASIGYSFLTFDDSYLIYGNLAAHAPTFAHIKQAFTTFDPELYIPITLLSYQINYLFAGLSGGLYHFTNIALHALNGALVSYLIFLFLGQKRLSLALGLIFVIHPLNTEAVVWLSGRKDLLSSTFYLATMCLYLKFLYTGNRRLWLTAVILFILGLLSKVSVLTLPIAVLLLEALMRERKEWTIRSLLNISPFFALSGIFAIIATFGKERVIGSSDLLETFIMAAKSTIFYVEKFFVPTNLSPIYPYMKVISISSSDFFVPLIVLGIVGLISVMILRQTKWPLVTLLLFISTLSPSFLNFHKGTGVFFAVDRYAYLPTVWLLLILGVAYSEIHERLQQRMSKEILVTVIGIGSIGLAFASMKQTSYWKDDETLFSHVLTIYPESVSARTSLAAVYREQGRQFDEVTILEEGLKIHKDVAYYTGIGSVAAAQGKLSEAETLYNQARILDSTNPEPFFFLGALEEQRGNVEMAIGDYKEAIRMDKSYVAAYNNLGAIYLDQRKLSEAEEMFRNTLVWNPNFMEGNYNLFQVLEMQKKQEEAFPYLEKAYELNPNNTEILFTIGYRYSVRDKKTLAVRVLKHLLQIDPSHTGAKRLLDQLEPIQKKFIEQTTSQKRQERLLERTKL